MSPGIVELRGKMTDCPERLSTGASLIVTIDVYMLPAAFVPVGHATSEDRSKLHFGEGSETQGELDLRERKSAILKMFEVLGLKPQAEAIQRGGKQEGELHQNAPMQLGKQKVKAKEIVGDGEEIEVEEEETLSKNDLDMIYEKCAVLHCSRLAKLIAISELSKATVQWEKWSPLTRSIYRYEVIKSKRYCRSHTDTRHSYS